MRPPPWRKGPQGRSPAKAARTATSSRPRWFRGQQLYEGGGESSRLSDDEIGPGPPNGDHLSARDPAAQHGEIDRPQRPASVAADQRDRAGELGELVLEGVVVGPGSRLAWQAARMMPPPHEPSWCWTSSGRTSRRRARLPCSGRLLASAAKASSRLVNRSGLLGPGAVPGSP